MPPARREGVEPRSLDATLTFEGDVPREGEAIRYDISIDRFLEDGDSLLFFSTYRGTVGGRPLLRIAHRRLLRGLLHRRGAARRRGHPTQAPSADGVVAALDIRGRWSHPV